MPTLGKVVYLTEAQKNTLFTHGSVTSNGITVTYSPNDLYVTPEEIDSTPISGGTNPISSGGVYSALSNYISNSKIGATNGVAGLDANGLVPTSQLPSYVDDVLEYSSTSAFPATGSSGKIYVATNTNLTYRWSGSAYVEISPSLALGTTSSTAFRGDYGNSAYAHAVTNKGSAFSSGLYKITTNSEGHVTAATAVAKADITGLGIPGSDTNTHRPIQVNGTQILGDNTTALNLKAGTNVTVTNSSGTVTFAATDTTYSAGTGLSLSGTTINHSNSVTSGTAGTSSATSGSTLAVPYVTYDAQGHITGSGTHTHTVSGFLTSSSTLDATKLSGTIPAGCYTNTTYDAITNAQIDALFT